MTISIPEDLGEFVRGAVQDGRYSSTDAVVERALRLLLAAEPDPTIDPGPTPAGPSLLEEFESLRGDVPDQTWAALPTDLSAEHDHYLYGSPRKSP